MKLLEWKSMPEYGESTFAIKRALKVINLHPRITISRFILICLPFVQCTLQSCQIPDLKQLHVNYEVSLKLNK